MCDWFKNFVSGSLPGPCSFVYEYPSDTRRLTLRLILPDSDVASDTAPQERWNCDMMTPKGETTFKQIVLVGEIEVMAAALSGNCTHYSSCCPCSDAETQSFW